MQLSIMNDIHLYWGSTHIGTPNEHYLAYTVDEIFIIYLITLSAISRLYSLFSLS